MKHVLVCLLLVSLLAPAAHARGSGSDRRDISQILFPETKTWQNVDSLPQPDTKMILRDRWLLRSIYLKSRGNFKTRGPTLTEEPDCSFITRALYEHLDMGELRSVDMDGDGNLDIAYFGYAECNEGDAAVVWFGKPHGLAERDVAIVPFQVLRLETTDPRRICSVQRGCCGDRVDEYFMGDLLNPRRLAQVRVHNGLDLPTGMEIAHEPYAARNKIVVRVAPIERDEYDPAASGFMGRAVMGNIVARYLPGAEGTILAYFKDEKGRRWGLLEFDKNSRSLRSDVAYDVDVGWMRLE